MHFVVIPAAVWAPRWTIRMGLMLAVDPKCRGSGVTTSAVTPLMTRDAGAVTHNDPVDTVSALLWRGGAVRRGATVGLCVGVFFGGLAWLDSGSGMVGLIVFVVLAIGLGTWTTRQAGRYWPGARELTGAQRESVVMAAQRGERIGDPKLAGAVSDYGRALHRAADDNRPLRWMLVFLLVVAVGSAAWDAVSGTWGNLIVSAIYLVLIGLELFWWPRRQAQLLANVDRAADLARQGDVAD